MNLYLITRPESLAVAYDEKYDGAVVAADTEEEARLMHPGGDPLIGGWIPSSRVIVTKIGVADPGIERGVLLADYNAG